MAVQIVGEDPKALRECTCPDCAAKLQFVQADVSSYQYSAMGEMDTAYYIVCPRCQHNVPVPRFNR